MIFFGYWLGLIGEADREERLGRIKKSAVHQGVLRKKATQNEMSVERKSMKK